MEVGIVECCIVIRSIEHHIGSSIRMCFGRPLWFLASALACIMEAASWKAAPWYAASLYTTLNTTSSAALCCGFVGACFGFEPRRRRCGRSEAPVSRWCPGAGVAAGPCCLWWHGAEAPPFVLSVVRLCCVCAEVPGGSCAVAPVWQLSRGACVGIVPRRP